MKYTKVVLIVVAIKYQYRCIYMYLLNRILNHDYLKANYFSVSTTDKKL